MHMQHSVSSPFGTPSHQATPPGQSNQQQHQQQPQQQLFFTPQQPRSSNPFQFAGQDPSAFSSVQSNSTPKPVESAQLGAGAGAGGQRQKGHRHSTGSYSRGNEFRPLNSSPLARSSKFAQAEDDMDDDEDDHFSSHQPSSPLGRVSFLPPPTSSSSVTIAPAMTPMWNMGTARSTRRRPKTLGRDSDDDDEVNPSPLVQRRRAQYKSTGPSTMPRAASAIFTPARRFPPSASAMSSGSWSSSPTSSPPVAALFERPRTVDADEDPRRAFLRERFKKRYFARATKAREKAVKARRRRVEGTEDYFANDGDDGDSDDDGNRNKRKSKGKGKAISDDEDMDDDDEEGEEEILNDELFSRIVANMNRKTQHAYRVSYAREIGSSFDPDIEDVSRWEDELRAEPVHHPFPTSSSTSSTAFPSSSSSRNFPPSSSGTFSTPSSGTIRPDIGSSPPRAPTEYEYDGAGEEDDDEEDFADFEDAEIEAYAEEYARAHEQELEAQQAGGSGVVPEQQQQSSNGGANEDDVLAGLEDIPEDELFGEWNWSESEPEGPIGGGKVDEDEDMDWS